MVALSAMTPGRSNVIELNSADVPVRDRFSWWCAMTEQEMAPTLISSPHADDFHASVTILQLGQTTVTAPEFEDMHSTRTAKLIRRSDPEQWWLTLVRAGSMWIEQDRKHAHLTAGDLVLETTSLPFRCGVARQNGAFARTITLQLPRRQLPLPERLLRDLAARALPSSHGAGALLGAFMENLMRHRTELGTAENARLGAVANDLATLFLSQLTGDAVTPAPGSRRQALIQQIKSFVRQNLGRRDLSPSTIAAAHHISVRYLHHLFEQEEQSVGRYIVRGRLKRCRADLADPLLSGRTIAQIAARWGFADASSFNRAFKAAYGMTPGDYRASQLDHLTGTIDSAGHPST
ncbi:helix-turn-helix domain-containing protein [Nonomuraea thailandensis]